MADPYVESFVAHLLKFVRMGSWQYAKGAALFYAQNEPDRLRDLPARLDVEMSLWNKTKREVRGTPVSPRKTVRYQPVMEL